MAWGHFSVLLWFRLCLGREKIGGAKLDVESLKEAEVAVVLVVVVSRLGMLKSGMEKKKRDKS
jgi:hypothetical protein